MLGALALFATESRASALLRNEVGFIELNKGNLVNMWASSIEYGDLVKTCARQGRLNLVDTNTKTSETTLAECERRQPPSSERGERKRSKTGLRVPSG
jgi:hypothetical protein